MTARASEGERVRRRRRVLRTLVVGVALTIVPLWLFITRNRGVATAS